MHRPLMIDDRTMAAASKVREYAEKREHWYVVDAHMHGKTKCPGDMPEHTVIISTYRCVFSYTRIATGQVYRHLSISVPVKGKYPNPVSAYALAQLFGFTGWDLDTWDGRSQEFPADWSVGKNAKQQCIVMAQIIDQERIPQ